MNVQEMSPHHTEGFAMTSGFVDCVSSSVPQPWRGPKPPIPPSDGKSPCVVWSRTRTPAADCGLSLAGCAAAAEFTPSVRPSASTAYPGATIRQSDRMSKHTMTSSRSNASAQVRKTAAMMSPRMGGSVSITRARRVEERDAASVSWLCGFTSFENAQESTHRCRVGERHLTSGRDTACIRNCTQH